MLKNSILFSFLVSLLSLMVVFLAPITITIVETGNIKSPYLEEINELTEKAITTGMMPSEDAYLNDLIEKNNQWIDELQNNTTERSPTDLREFWIKKSNYISPGIMILWGLLFYFFYKSITQKFVPYVFIFPILLLFAQLMSILEVILISLAVLSVWFWKEIIMKERRQV